MTGTSHVIIIGAGFAGTYAADALRKAPVRVTMIDHNLYSTFQPLLYQVATGGLNPADVAYPAAGSPRIDARAQRVSGETVVSDVVLFNPQAGHLLAAEAKSGANLEPEQGRRLTALTPPLLVSAGGITVPKPVLLRCGPAAPDGRPAAVSSV